MSFMLNQVAVPAKGASAPARQASLDAMNQGCDKTEQIAYNLPKPPAPGSDRLATDADKRQCLKRLDGLLQPHNCASPAFYW